MFKVLPLHMSDRKLVKKFLENRLSGFREKPEKRFCWRKQKIAKIGVKNRFLRKMKKISLFISGIRNMMQKKTYVNTYLG